jgi:uncharacterized protein with PCYCGC motif
MSSGGSRIALTALLAALAIAGCGDAPARETAAAPAAAPAPAPVTPPAAVVQVPAAQTSADASRNDVDSPPSIRDEDLPPLPETPFPAARPMEVVKAVYTFAARHPEVLSKVPCFCGCENRGHRHNDDCFVAARDARGVPTSWEPHGVG